MLPAEQLADVPESAGMVHDDVAERIPPAVICFRHRVAVGFEAVIGFGEFLFRSVWLMPIG